MECRYCQTLNAEDDHRCRRCGRRLRMTPVYTARSAAAPVLRPEPEEVPVAAHPPIAEPVAIPKRKITYQPSLFSSKEVPRVVPFESIAGTAVEAAAKRSASLKPRIRRAKPIPGQQDLAFASATTARYTRPSEGVIYCDAPVAIPAHRAMAAALDGSMILIGLAVFGSIFHLAGGTVVINAKTIPLLIVVAGVMAILYKLLWCLGNGDTAGMRWTHLTLVNFDGKHPDRRQRIYRMASGCLSFLAAGLGLLWALVDEETLTWHDHISKTFPTPV